MKKTAILTIVFAFYFCEFSPLSNDNGGAAVCKQVSVDFKNVFPILDVFDFKGEVKSVRVYQIDYSSELDDFHDTEYVYQCNFNRCGMLEDEITFKKNLDTMQIRHYSYNNDGNLAEIIVRNPMSGSSATNQVIYSTNSVWISGTTYYHGSDNLIDSIRIPVSGQKQMQYYDYDNRGNLTRDIFMVDSAVWMGYEYDYNDLNIVETVTFIGNDGVVNAIWDIAYDSNGFINGFESSSTQSIGTYHWGPYIEYQMDNRSNWVTRIRTSKMTDEKIYKHSRTIEYY